MMRVKVDGVACARARLQYQLDPWENMILGAQKQNPRIGYNHNSLFPITNIQSDPFIEIVGPNLTFFCVWVLVELAHLDWRSPNFVSSKYKFAQNSIDRLRIMCIQLLDCPIPPPPPLSQKKTDHFSSYCISQTYGFLQKSLTVFLTT